MLPETRSIVLVKRIAKKRRNEGEVFVADPDMGVHTEHTIGAHRNLALLINMRLAARSSSLFVGRYLALSVSISDT